MACTNDLEVDKLLVWRTELPSEHKSRISRGFSLMGSQWCLVFSYREPNKLYGTWNHHCITLHQMTNGKILTTVYGLCEKKFCVKAYIQHPTKHVKDEFGVMNNSVDKTTSLIWSAGQNNKEAIFKTLPWLYDQLEVKFVCHFYGHPPSTFQLQMGAEPSTVDRRVLPIRCIDKSVLVTSEVPVDTEALSKDFSRLLEKKILTDVKLKCGDRVFQAHKSVLAARSEVLEAMFQNKMLESETGTVTISDVDASIIDLLLKFIYSGTLKDLSEETAAGLYKAADKYAVLSLKTACSYWIMRNLTEENCIDYLSVADSHSDHNLRASVVSFIVKNPGMLKSEAWLTYSKDHQESANDVLQTYVSIITQ